MKEEKSRRNEMIPSGKKEITIKHNTKEAKLKKAPDEVLAMAIRDMMKRDKEK